MNSELFLKLVIEMREAQKNFFIGHDYHWLQKVKALEKQVDTAIETYKDNLKKLQPIQLDLFSDL